MVRRPPGSIKPSSSLPPAASVRKRKNARRIPKGSAIASVSSTSLVLSSARADCRARSPDSREDFRPDCHIDRRTRSGLRVLVVGERCARLPAPWRAAGQPTTAPSPTQRTARARETRESGSIAQSRGSHERCGFFVCFNHPLYDSIRLGRILQFDRDRRRRGYPVA